MMCIAHELSFTLAECTALSTGQEFKGGGGVVFIPCLSRGAVTNDCGAGLCWVLAVTLVY